MKASQPKAEPGPSFKADFFRTYADVKNLPASLAGEIAFIGRSNAGKSSLLNAIANRKDLARTSATPGKTQHLNYFTVRWKSAAEPGEQTEELCFFVDLPGYGYAKVARSLRKQFADFI